MRLTNRAKVFWPELGVTKGELCDYYAAISDFMLPYLRERPVVLTRYPDGVHGKSFFQWNVPAGMPSFIGSQELPAVDEEPAGPRSSKPARPRRVFVLNDLESLLYVANLGCIPIHMLASRAGSLGACDFFNVDLDVRGSTLHAAIELAQTLRAHLAAVGLPAYCKTSGQSGLHVLVPLGPGVSFATARVLATLCGRLLVAAHPNIATMERTIDRRAGRVYVDIGQNGPSRTIVAPWSARASASAGVSTPLSWAEVVPALEPAALNVRTAVARAQTAGDPMRAMLDARPDLPTAIAAFEGLARRGAGPDARSGKPD